MPAALKYIKVTRHAATALPGTDERQSLSSRDNHPETVQAGSETQRNGKQIAKATDRKNIFRAFMVA